jgi:hypothetical protein
LQDIIICVYSYSSCYLYSGGCYLILQVVSVVMAVIYVTGSVSNGGYYIRVMRSALCVVTNNASNSGYYIRVTRSVCSNIGLMAVIYMLPIMRVLVAIIYVLYVVCVVV